MTRVIVLDYLLADKPQTATLRHPRLKTLEAAAVCHAFHPLTPQCLLFYRSQSELLFLHSVQLLVLIHSRVVTSRPFHSAVPDEFISVWDRLPCFIMVLASHPVRALVIPAQRHLVFSPLLADQHANGSNMSRTAPGLPLFSLFKTENKQISWVKLDIINNGWALHFVFNYLDITDTHTHKVLFLIFLSCLLSDCRLGCFPLETTPPILGKAKGSAMPG